MGTHLHGRQKEVTGYGIYVSFTYCSIWRSWCVRGVRPDFIVFAVSSLHVEGNGGGMEGRMVGKRHALSLSLNVGGPVA